MGVDSLETSAKVPQCHHGQEEHDWPHSSRFQPPKRLTAGKRVKVMLFDPRYSFNGHLLIRVVGFLPPKLFKILVQNEVKSDYPALTT